MCCGGGVHDERHGVVAAGGPPLLRLLVDVLGKIEQDRLAPWNVASNPHFQAPHVNFWAVITPCALRSLWLFLVLMIQV